MHENEAAVSFLSKYIFMTPTDRIYAMEQRCTVHVGVGLQHVWCVHQVWGLQNVPWVQQVCGGYSRCVVGTAGERQVFERYNMQIPQLKPNSLKTYHTDTLP